MTYTALARTWRPKTFAELVGQEHVRRALVNALEQDRVHHAFLFTGTRGVGKTTIARILAKCLNCETGVTPEPCGVCASCREIDAGRFVDLIEVDAASRTKVDDTRDLLDNVQYSPTRGRYKVYLIDEVHMLSTHSFNALLKTLEEPPPHVKFLLATTDPQKLPPTVLSRCLQFNLKRLPITQISARLQLILEKEQIAFEPAGVRLIAQAADGSLRDALSLLDQLIAFGGGRAGEEEARAMLGTVTRDHVVRLAELLATLDPRELLRFARSLEEWAPDYAQVLDELAALLVRIALRQTVPDFEGDELYSPELLARLAGALAAEDVQLFYQTAVTGRRDLALAPDPRTGFEMTLLRMMAFRPLPGSEQAGNPHGTAGESRPARSAPKALLSEARSDPRALLSDARPARNTTQPPGPQGASVRSTAGGAADRVGSGEPHAWSALVSQLELQGAARQLASHCLLVAREGAVVRLAIDPRNKSLCTPTATEKLAQALARHFGGTVRLEFEAAAAGAPTPADADERASLRELDDARRAFEADPGVQALRERFGATLLPDTVRPVK